MANEEKTIAQGESNPIQKALDDYTDMKDRLQAALAESDQLRDMNRALSQENNLLRDNYAEARRQFQQVQAFAVGLSTRLGTVQDIISRAVKESMEFSAATSAQAKTSNPPDLTADLERSMARTTTLIKK